MEETAVVGSKCVTVLSERSYGGRFNLNPAEYGTLR